MNAGDPGLHVESVNKGFRLGPSRVEVLHDVTLHLAPGEALAVTGPSGSGKSTLLHLIGALEAPDSGSIHVGGTDLATLSDVDLARFRNQSIGFVFQHHHLLPQYTVLENVLLPTLAFAKSGRGAAAGQEAWARELLDRVGLSPRLDHRPGELSGGERQRAALARALVMRPAVLLCDEPTGSLDPETAQTVGDLLLELHRVQESILVTVTHSEALAERFPRRCALVHGQCSAL
ncbi:MAG: ABC transporter ATP-binding protein [Thermoanaerobaculia bacterium]|nr:ABC transporter ATP-binding protein [Thermoanaerobaculia bacterium]